MALTISNIAKVSTIATLTEKKQVSSSQLTITPQSENEQNGLGIGQLFKANKVQSKEKNNSLLKKKDEKKNMGFVKKNYNDLGQMGLMVAQKRTGSSQALKGSLLSKKI